MRKLLLGFLICAAFLPALPAQSQDEHPLIRMLSMTPAEAGTLEPGTYLNLKYADLRANEQARPGVPTPASWADYEALDEEQVSLWLANYFRLIGAAPDFESPILYDGQMVDYYGLDFFEIDQTLSFISPTIRGALYGGHFDTDRMIRTLTGRTYTLNELNGIPVLCGPVGCENGSETSQWLPDQDRDEVSFRMSGAYPIFGGRMGQQQPIGLLPDTLLSTAHWETMGKMTALAAETGESLYDVPDYRAVADFAVTGDLIQVIFFEPVFFNVLNFSAVLEFAAEDMGVDRETVMETLQVDASGKPLAAEDLPAYSVGALVDGQDGPDQVHQIVLVYRNEADAQFAAAEMSKRIPLQRAYLVSHDERPLIDIFAPGYTLDPPQAVPQGDRWLAVATVRVPLPSNEPDPAHDDNIPASGRLLLVWYRSMMMDDFMPVKLP